MGDGLLAAIVAAAISTVLALIAAARHQRLEPSAAEIEARAQALRALGASPDVADALANGDRLTAIKLYREDHGVGLRAAKQAIDVLLAHERAAALQVVGGSARVAELLARGQKIAAIKAYREEYGAGLREAKDAVERLELFSDLMRP